MHVRHCLRIALAQIDTTVGDLTGNVRRVRDAWERALESHADLVVFPELTLTGYPPEDLLLKPSFLEDSRAALEALAPQLTRGIVFVGFADPGPAGPHNAAAVITDGRVRDIYHKCTLPNYGVFDERRYFAAGDRCPVYTCGPWRLAVNICEDLWVSGGVPTLQASEGRANVIVNLSASPYHARKGRLREELITTRARQLGLAVLQTNLIGGQDELVFDGQSLAADATGRLLGRAAQFREDLLIVDLPLQATQTTAPPVDASAADPGGASAADATRRGTHVPATSPLSTSGNPADPTDGGRFVGPHFRGTAPPIESLRLDCRPLEGCAPTPHPCRQPAPETSIRLELGEEEEVYRALTLALADYVHKNGFRGVVLGISGGIDSALTAVIAVDALGAGAVVGISMPSRYTSAETRADARRLAENLGIAFHEVPVDDLFAQTCRQLDPLFGDRQPDQTEENIQARIRGMLLMAYSNKFGHLVLATGNKSEVAVGYCTLYGDMVGGFAVLKDILKTHVYELARWRNTQAPEPAPIPQATLERPPSAELRAGQKDTDSLPPYETLDPIVRAFVEDDAAPRDLRAAGFPAALVDRVFRMIQGNEYKRRQAAPGIKITPRAFGRDRRYPLTNRYVPGQR
ncbi:MAG: NAD+ synthase [Candidatus Eisenbacteria sp.]|nr:NAD+ synthase [Candidatus Eisenbacteria bacterium]